MNGLPCFERTNLQTGQKYMILIDTGATNNYISRQAVQGIKHTPVSPPIYVQTIHGKTPITSYIYINIFSRDIKFFILKHTGHFDLIFGMDGLRQINANLDLTALTMSYTVNTQLQHYTTNTDATDPERLAIDGLIRANNNQELLPFNTKVNAEIRTTTNTPVWTKQFPYPMSSRDFVNEEID